jgi:hypothetical protein
MYPDTGEWAELLVLFLLGPLHVVACAIIAAIAWWRAPRWSTAARIAVLATNVLLASVPVATALSVGTENPWFHQFGLVLVGCEVAAVGGLAAALLLRRAAVAPQR